ncbi:amino acid adenylation domain-containing protein [Streptomyces sp. NPDC016309]|uniref:amino acid adenylation domain-containing protein n=1 Tax=Streptomyces sp. NPDC016309 TaxID=3364965 RepID=UPI0036F81B2E
MTGAVVAPRAAGAPAATSGGPPLIHRAVEWHAARRPDAVALVDGARHVGYAELDAAAEVWAAALRVRGAGPGTFVPVVLPRSATLVAVLLGVLKSGAAYAALDPGWPAERLRAVAGMLAPRVAVVPDGCDWWDGRDGWDRRDGRGDGGGGNGASLCTPAAHGLLPRDAAGAPPVPGEEERDAAPPVVDGDSPATVFFTSGTTGRPKAVVSPHRATLSLFDGRFAPFTSDGPDRPVMPQAAPVSWDGFTLETWGPLISGGTSVLLDGGFLLPGTLRGLVARRGVDTVWLTASLFHLFVDEDPGCFEGLRHVLTGGERLSAARVRAFLDRHPDIALTNGYGPVETCVFATARRVRRSDCDVPTGIPVGEPVPGRRVHVLADGRPAAPGSTGEICVAGDGIALGYLGDPELTARAFPTVTVDGVPTRVYRTGDLGFRDDDGVLHFTGRADRQVKVRGHRVEPEEVEAVVRTVPGVADCAVVPVPGPDGQYERLALFYTEAGTDDPPPPRAVRRALAALLPRHLVPELVRVTAALPLTAHGKLDRTALPRLLEQGRGDGGETGA